MPDGAFRFSGDMCANGSIKPPMKEGYRCQDIECVLFGNMPMNFGSVAGGVAEGAENAFDEDHEALMLVMFVGCS
jgi:hypothetical protein